MANFIFSPNNVKTILDAIDYFYMLQPALDELIDFSENIENSAEAVYNSIYDKLDSDGEFSFSEDEAFSLETHCSNIASICLMSAKPLPLLLNAIKMPKNLCLR